MPRRIERSPFVGRREVMERLEALLEDAAGGSGHTVTLSGEAGIGKTRVAEELCTLARRCGADVAWGGCFEGEGAPLYWPWSQVMRDLIEARGAEAVRKQLGRGAAAVAEVIPPVAEALPAVRPPRAVENPAMARFRVFEAMAGFLRKASAANPLLMVLDDLHWADEPTLALLSFLSRDVARSKVLLVATYRDLEVRRRALLELALADLSRERGHEQVELHPLELPDVKRYLTASRAGDPAEGEAERLLSQTEGNPFLLVELARFRGNGPRQVEAGLTVPTTVREVLARRLEPLSAGCSALLTAAAGMGREFDVHRLAAVQGEPAESGLLGLLDEGLASGLIEEVSADAGRYRFCHVLTQQALLARLAAGERARLHGRIAEALERSYGAGTDSHARELVEHLEQARPVAGTERLGHYLRVAGEQALSSHAWEEARSLYSRALELREGLPEDVPTADLLFGLGRAQSALADPAAVASCTRAFRIYDSLGQVHRAVAVAVFGVYSQVEQSGDVRAMGERALGLVESGSLDEAAILAQHALRQSVAMSSEERWRWLRKAMRVARRERATALEVVVIRQMRLLSYDEGDFAAAGEWASREYALAFQVGDLYAQCSALYAADQIGVTSGAKLDAAARHAHALRSAAEALRDRRWLGAAYFSCERLAWRALDWTRARELCDRFLSVAPGDPARSSGFLHQALIRYQLCEFDAGDRSLANAVEIVDRLPGWVTQRSNVANFVTQHALMSGRPVFLEVADRFATEALADGRTMGQARYYARAAKGRLAVIRGDGKAADACMRDLQADGFGGGAPARMDPVVGLLARTTGRNEAAVRLLRAAERLAAEVEHEFRRLWNAYYLAETLAERSRSGDLEEAERLLGELLETTERTGSVLLERKCRALLERLSASPRSDGLTERQIEVLRQIAAGKANKEIAYSLGISTSTVNMHVRRILERIGAANRAEAASYATRNGLADGGT